MAGGCGCGCDERRISSKESFAHLVFEVYGIGGGTIGHSLIPTVSAFSSDEIDWCGIRVCP